MQEYNIQELLDRHSEMQKKPLEEFTLEDCRNRITLKQEVWDTEVHMEADYERQKTTLDKDKSKLKLELKAMTNELGKKTHTDSTADGVINEEFFEEDIKLIAMKESAKLLRGRYEIITDFVNIIKKRFSLDKDFGDLSFK